MNPQYGLKFVRQIYYEERCQTAKCLLVLLFNFISITSLGILKKNTKGWIWILHNNTIENFVAARREIGLEVNAEKTNYIFMFQEDKAE